MARKLRIKSR